jgi:hypothetical protein
MCNPPTTSSSLLLYFKKTTDFSFAFRQKQDRGFVTPSHRYISREKHIFLSSPLQQP